MTPPPKKAFGQNFLTDEETARTVVRVTGMGPETSVVEIGPGRGFLTRFLVESGASLLAVEKDPDLPAALEAQFGSPRFRVVCADFMEVDLESLAPAPMVLVGNLPYYVSVGILGKALDARPGLVSQMVFMFQKEVAVRLCAQPKDDAFGVPSVMAQVNHIPRLIRKVPAGAFFPRPNVDSALVHLLPKPTPLLPPQERCRFLDWVGSVFRYRRKTARNAISLATGLSTAQIEAALHTAAIEADARLETVGIEQLLGLWQALA